MPVRARLASGLTRAAKALAGPAPRPPVSEPQAMVQAAQDVSQMGPQHPFSPGEPVRPYDGYSRTPRSQDFETSYNVATRPRTHERVSFDTLRGLIEAYDVAQIAIWHRIDSIRSLDWKLIASDGFEGDISGAIAAGTAVLKRPDRINSFSTWLAKWLYDVLAYDAGCLYRMRNRGGRCIGLSVVDGTTIAPLLDYWGNPPAAPAEAYVQYANGLPWNWLTRDDLIYESFRPRSNSPYGHAPLESVILNANTDLRFQVYFLQRFTDGNIPAALASAPESWGPDQIDQWQELWDSFMFGDQSRKSQIRWIPGGSTLAWSNEKDFTDSFSLFLMRKTAAAYHVVPSDLGFTETVNLSSSESQSDVQHRVGELPLDAHIEGILTSFLQDDMGLPVQFTFDKGEEQEDQLAQAQADGEYIDRGVVSSSEIREMRYGLSEPAGQQVPRYIFTARSGPVPLASLYAVAGPVDPQTAAPVPGSPLPRTAFLEVEGVVPNPPLMAEPLAEQEYGPAALPPAPPPQPGAVAKDGAPTAGITSETGITGYDGPGHRDDDPDDEDDDPVALAKAELAAFRQFRRARRRAGQWRDFRFTAVDPVRAHRLNDAGRLAVRKDTGQIAVAGLAVLAADTGRVLMLQRALDPDDPAGGTWEFPGGHLEGDETPLQGAWREWAEETGAIPPPGAQTGTWTSPNGIYQGIVWTVDTEASVPVRCDTLVSNPDDPDGDQVEAIAWWNPAQLDSSPGALRYELLSSLHLVLPALGYAEQAACCACCGGAGEHSTGHECYRCDASGTPSAAEQAEPFCDEVFRDPAVHAQGCPSCGPAGQVAKAGASLDPKGREWPGWQYNGPAAAYWAAHITAAATAALTASQLQDLAAAYLAQPPPQQAGDVGKRARNGAAAQWLQGRDVSFAFAGLATSIVTDGFLIGAISADAAITGAAVDSGGWQPGDTVKAAKRIQETAAAPVLGSAQDTAQTADRRMNGAYLNALAVALVSGADAGRTAAELAAVLAGVLASTQLAAGVALDVITSASAVAAQDAYAARRIDQVDVLNGPNPCPTCLELAETSPHDPGNVPVHLHCECAEVPHAPS